MKFTNDVAKRCDDMLRQFAKKNKLDVESEHSEFRRESQVKFGDHTYYIRWDEVRSLSDACTNIFVDLTRKWDLDGYNTSKAFKIKNVVFNDPATIILWEDDTKTVVKCQEGDTYSKETGLALCIAKKALGNQGNFNEVFKKWIPEEEVLTVTVTDAKTGKKSTLESIVKERVTQLIYQALMEGDGRE